MSADLCKGFMIAIVISAVVIIAALDAQENKFKQEAVDVGAAYYDSKTSEFKWRKP
jgi:hypothetical protein